MKKRVLLTLLAFTLVNVLFVSCPITEEQQKRALEGTWVDAYGATIDFNNGKFISNHVSIPYLKGTYTVSGAALTLTIIDVWGGKWDNGFDLQNRYYSKAEIKEIFIQEYAKVGYEWTADANRNFEDMFTQTMTFEVNGNTLTLTEEGSQQPKKYTRR